MRCRPQYLRYMHRDQRWLVPVAIHELLISTDLENPQEKLKVGRFLVLNVYIYIDYILIIDYWDF